jgi:uncharacterized membrane protein YjjP (DUF1212 family)
LHWRPHVFTVVEATVIPSSSEDGQSMLQRTDIGKGVEPPASASHADRDLTILDCIATVARLLFVNGQTTEATRLAVVRLGRALAVEATLLVRWGELVVQANGRAIATVAADPFVVDMKRVAGIEQLVDDICDGRLSLDGAQSSLDAVSRAAPVSATRFAVMAAIGAAALGVIFGTVDPITLALIAFSAGAGAVIRRILARFTPNPLIQPLCAALFSGLTGAAATHGLAAAPHLVMVCPCMVLVPGPHVLNGALDLARARIPIGAARIAFASLVVLMISTGLMVGLSLAGATLSDPSPAKTVPLVLDVIAAGVAVAAYGSFFNMPWKTLSIPVVIGMAAHAARWIALQQGASLQTGAFIACLLVGLVVTPLADRIRMPFAAFAFASVVSMIPGVLLFQVAADLLALLQPEATMNVDLLLSAVRDMTTAFVIVVAMTLGLAIPKMGLGWLHGSLTQLRRLS